jgi:membrane fusion protein (multidrug efflux system)
MAPASAQDKANPAGEEAIPKAANKVKELQTERIATLKEMAELSTQLFQSGHGSPEAALEARVLVFEAELEAAEKQSDRIALYKNLVQVLTEFEAVATQRVDAAQWTKVSVLKVKARRLDAEIRLEQAKANHADPKPEHDQVVVTRPAAKDVLITKQYTGQIHSRRHIEIRSLQSGYLEEISVKEGQAVRKGDMLFKVAPVLYAAKWDAALAEVTLAELELQRAERLYQNKVVSQEEVAQFKAKLAKAQANAKLAEAELNFTSVRAPFDGIIDRLHEQQGSLITERDILTTLSDNSVMWVYFNVPQAQYLEYVAAPGQDQKGKDIELDLGSGGKSQLSGKIAAIEAQFDSETGTIPFRADFPNADGVMRHGMIGKVIIPQALHNAIVIPQRASFEALGKRYVYIVDQDDVAHRREIVVQHELGSLLIIEKGLDVNDKIVLEGMRQIQDGEKVEYEFRNP